MNKRLEKLWEKITFLLHPKSKRIFKCNDWTQKIRQLKVRIIKKVDLQRGRVTMRRVGYLNTKPLNTSSPKLIVSIKHLGFSKIFSTFLALKWRVAYFDNMVIMVKIYTFTFSPTDVKLLRCELVTLTQCFWYMYWYQYHGS